MLSVIVLQMRLIIKKGKIQIVVIKGNPHKKSSSNMLANDFMRDTKKAEHTIIKMDAAHMDIHPYLGCDYCGMNGYGVQKDDIKDPRCTSFIRHV